MKFYYIRMMKYGLAFLFCLLACLLRAQGGWDIAYSPIQSLEKAFIGREIRLDFKQNPFEVRQTVDLHYYLWKYRDTIALPIDDKMVLFREDWRIYDDMGFLGDQNLCSLAPQAGKFWRIREIFLRDFDEQQLTCEARLYGGEKERELPNNAIPFKAIIFTLKRAEVKGILYAFPRN